MTGTQYTPGPWAVVTSTPSLIEGPDGSPALAQALLFKGDESIGEAWANARLIAVAPDLLAALKDAMRSSRKDFKVGPDGDRQHREAYAEQFAAIAKATTP